MLQTTIGQLLVNDSLPPDMRDYTRELDKGGIKQLFEDLAARHPEQYRDIAKKLSDAGRSAATASGGHSFTLKHLRTAKAARLSRQRLNRRIDTIMKSKLSPEARRAKIVEATSAEQQRLGKEIYEEALAEGNPLALQVRSGARGKPAQLQRLIGGDLQYMDHRDNPIPFPVQHSYAEGLSSPEWFAAAFGARKGLVDTKFATQDAGFFAKQLNQVAHRLIVTAQDSDEEYDATRPRGLPVSVDDPDSEGSYLAHEVGGYPRNTVITPKILNDLKNQGVNRLLVRSPMVGGPASGVYARDVGVRDRGETAHLGDLSGLGASQALSERMTQGQLESKHAGGVKGSAKSVRGFDYVNSMIQVPKHMKGAAAHAQEDGKVENIEAAPAGGQFVWIRGQKHFVPPGFDLKVAVGDEVEAGDMISDGIPHPGMVVQHKGSGEGRRYFMDKFTAALRESGLPAHRRNVELIARGLIDYVEMLEDTDDHAPGDLMSYSQLESTWQPRSGTQRMKPKQALGQYLERPILHYSIGTKIRKSMLKDFEDFGVDHVEAHSEPPPFQPRMIRAMDVVGHDPDVMTRMLGSNQKRSLLGAVRRGGSSDTRSTSFVPALAQGTPFGKDWPKSILKPPGSS